MQNSSSKPRRQTLVKPVEDRRMLAIVMMLFAYLMFTGLDTCAKWLVLQDIPAMEVVFARYALHTLIMLVVFLPKFGVLVFRSNNIGVEVLRAGALLASTVCNFIAVRYLPLTVTGSILFAMPLIVCALSIPILGERVGWRRWVAIFVGFIGVLIIIQPGGTSFHWAMFLALGTAFSVSLYAIMNRKLAGVDSSYTQQLYSGLLATLVIMPFAFFDWLWPSDLAGWIAFFGMGIFGGVGHLLLTIAHRFAPATTLAPFVYSQILYFTASSWIIFGDAPDFWVFIGAPIVIGSGLFVWLRERNLAT